MNPKTWINESSLDQFEVIKDLRNSLQLSYPELESLTTQYEINAPRIFPYLGCDPSPPTVEKYFNRVLKILETPIKEDYVRNVLSIMAIPIRDDYLRLALNSLATPIRDDYLRVVLNNISKSIREDHLRLVLEALMCAIREDCLRTAIEKFNDKGIEVQPTVTQVTGVIQSNIDFIKYSPSDRFDLIGEEKLRYIELKELGETLGVIENVFDRKMYKVPVEDEKALDRIDLSLFINGSIGIDGVYKSSEIIVDSVKHLYLPVYCNHSPTKEKVPKDFWVGQARAILSNNGWSKSNIRDLSRECFRTYKGKKPSRKVMSTLRYSLNKELAKRNARAPRNQF